MRGNGRVRGKGREDPPGSSKGGSGAGAGPQGREDLLGISKRESPQDIQAGGRVARGRGQEADRIHLGAAR